MNEKIPVPCQHMRASLFDEVLKSLRAALSIG
jgi:hypothetical protein